MFITLMYNIMHIICIVNNNFIKFHFHFLKIDF